jgi:tellurite methyltransferase
MLDDFKYPEPDPNKRPPGQVWDERYQADTYLFGKEPVGFLKHYVSALKKGKAIDVGMGEGRNAVFLAQQGFEVDAIDCSARGVEKTKALAAEKGVTVEAKVQNLDFFLMPLMRYQTIVMTYFRPQARFFSEIRRGLVAGGTFLLEAYTVEHLRSQPQPNPLIDFEECYKPNELLGYLKDFNILYYKELPEGSSHLVQLIAQKHK